MTDRILITMDDLESAVRINAAFEEAGLDTTMVSPMDDVAGTFRRANPDAVVLTGALHDPPAAHLVDLARERSVATLGLLEAAEPDASGFAQTAGLTGWVSKPVDERELVPLTRRLIERRRFQERTGIFGDSPAIQQVLVRIEQMAPVTSTVLIQGESGTGKELVAHAIHQASPRRDQKFIAVNCSALPDTLLESELFGHEKGSFTGAAERRLGRFELADGGTIFLDEVGEMPQSTQVKLLRVLESRSFFRVGGSESIKVDVRVVAATNRSLQEAVAHGDFREDLFFRLNVLSIYLPPLRERKSDIPLLVKRFVKQFSQANNKSFRGITAEAMQLLTNAHWPGNVRQLRNLIESMVVLAPGQEIDARDIPRDVREQGTRLLPAQLERAPESADGASGKQLEFIFRSLVDLKVEMEELRRRLDQQQATPLEMIDVTAGARTMSGDYEEDQAASAIDLTEPEDEEPAPVVFQTGMTMDDVEKAAIQGALSDSGGNRRKAAAALGIGERTLYRKIKEFGLE